VSYLKLPLNGLAPDFKLRFGFKQGVSVFLHLVQPLPEGFRSLATAQVINH
jgi:hypothetical protein